MVRVSYNADRLHCLQTVFEMIEHGYVKSKPLLTALREPNQCPLIADVIGQDQFDALREMIEFSLEGADHA